MTAKPIAEMVLTLVSEFNCNAHSCMVAVFNKERLE